jgi:hypothetical protein
MLQKHEKGTSISSIELQTNSASKNTKFAMHRTETFELTKATAIFRSS